MKEAQNIQKLPCISHVEESLKMNRIRTTRFCIWNEIFQEQYTHEGFQIQGAPSGRMEKRLGKVTDELGR